MRSVYGQPVLDQCCKACACLKRTPCLAYDEKQEWSLWLIKSVVCCCSGLLAVPLIELLGLGLHTRFCCICKTLNILVFVCLDMRYCHKLTKSAVHLEKEHLSWSVPVPLTYD